MSKLLIFFIIYNLAFVFSAFSQDNDICLEVLDGYVIKLKEQPKIEKQLKWSVDYLYFTELPKLTNESTPTSLYLNGGRLLDIEYLRSVNFERVINNEFVVFDSNHIFESYSYSLFYIEIYRCLITSFTKKEEVHEYVRTRESISHMYSNLSFLSKDKLSEKVTIIYPVVIKAW